jgi:hypothetical protein
MAWLLVVLAIVVVCVIVVVAIPQLRSRSLKHRFGPEYDHLVDEEGDRRSAEAELRGASSDAAPCRSATSNPRRARRTQSNG